MVRCRDLCVSFFDAHVIYMDVYKYLDMSLARKTRMAYAPNYHARGINDLMQNYQDLKSVKGFEKVLHEQQARYGLNQLHRTNQAGLTLTDLQKAQMLRAYGVETPPAYGGNRTAAAAQASLAQTQAQAQATLLGIRRMGGRVPVCEGGEFGATYEDKLDAHLRRQMKESDDAHYKKLCKNHSRVLLDEIGRHNNTDLHMTDAEVKRATETMQVQTAGIGLSCGVKSMRDQKAAIKLDYENSLTAVRAAQDARINTFHLQEKEHMKLFKKMEKTELDNDKKTLSCIDTFNEHKKSAYNKTFAAHAALGCVPEPVKVHAAKQTKKNSAYQKGVAAGKADCAAKTAAASMFV